MVHHAFGYHCQNVLALSNLPAGKRLPGNAIKFCKVPDNAFDFCLYRSSFFPFNLSTPATCSSPLSAWNSQSSIQLTHHGYQSTMARHWRQCLADDRRDPRRVAERARTDDPLCWYCQEQMGHQLSFHGILRLCLCPHLLGDLGV